VAGVFIYPRSCINREVEVKESTPYRVHREYCAETTSPPKHRRWRKARCQRMYEDCNIWISQSICYSYVKRSDHRRYHARISDDLFPVSTAQTQNIVARQKCTYNSLLFKICSTLNSLFLQSHYSQTSPTHLHSPASNPRGHQPHPHSRSSNTPHHPIAPPPYSSNHHTAYHNPRPHH
jgi:hypothetical protein